MSLIVWKPTWNHFGLSFHIAEPHWHILNRAHFQYAMLSGKACSCSLFTDSNHKSVNTVSVSMTFCSDCFPDMQAIIALVQQLYQSGVVRKVAKFESELCGVCILAVGGISRAGTKICILWYIAGNKAKTSETSCTAHIPPKSSILDMKEKHGYALCTSTYSVKSRAVMSQIITRLLHRKRHRSEPIYH